MGYLQLDILCQCQQYLSPSHSPVLDIQIQFNSLYSPNWKVKFILFTSVAISVSYNCDNFILGGSGHHFCLPDLLRDMSTSTLSTISSSKPGKYVELHVPACQPMTVIRSNPGSFFRMYGLFQTTFYFGYMAVFSVSLGILCGTIGYLGTRWPMTIRHDGVFT